jgi:hypothetical protein
LDPSALPPSLEVDREGLIAARVSMACGAGGTKKGSAPKGRGPGVTEGGEEEDEDDEALLPQRPLRQLAAEEAEHAYYHRIPVRARHASVFKVPFRLATSSYTALAALCETPCLPPLPGP